MLPYSGEEKAVAEFFSTHVNAGLTSIKSEGLLQIPQQLACALTSLAPFGIHSFVEIGTFAGWTTCVIAAFFQGYAGRSAASRMKAWTIDNMPRVGSCAKQQFAALGINLLHPDEIAIWHESMPKTVDLCFIDGDHSWAGISRDVSLLQDRCRFVMFHDIVGELGEDVPAFWEAFKAKHPQRRVWECTHQPAQASTSGSVMGIGIIQLMD